MRLLAKGTESPPRWPRMHLIALGPMPNRVRGRDRPAEVIRTPMNDSHDSTGS